MTAEKAKITKMEPMPVEDDNETVAIPSVTEESGQSMGDILINHSVVASIVRQLALDVEGVVSIGSGGLAEGLSEYIKGKDAGVSISEDEAKDYQIRLRVILAYGVELARAAQTLQRVVHDGVERMTMKSVSRVDVIIDGVRLPRDHNNPRESESLLPPHKED
ncbi:MAG: Asp23/Gls24 family envelope stress response protein [Opitutales bacterium]